MLMTILALVIGLALVGLVTGLASLTLTRSVNGLVNASHSVSVSGNETLNAAPTVPAAVVGVLSVRGSGTTGTLTMGTGHGLTTGQRVDLYWAGGQCYGAILGTVSGNSVPIASVIGGTVLPVVTTQITVGPTVLVAFNVVGDNMQALVESSGPVDGYFVIESSGAVLLANYVTAGQSFMWALGDDAVPLGSGVTAAKLYISQDGTAAQGGMYAVALVN